MGRKKKEIHVSGLPEPWKAYYSEKRQRIFYFNTETKQPTWEMPTAEKPSGLSSKELSVQHQQKTSDVLEKSWSTWKADGKRSDKLDCLHGLHVPNENETSEELMETDEIGIEEINCHEEPMEVDIVVEEVQAFRREHFLHPNLLADTSAPLFHKNAGACEKIENAGMVLIVFDTSCLLQDAALLPMCIQRLYCSLIPYTVLQELDGLKKAKSDELRSKAAKTIAYLHDCIKRGCNYLLMENTFEASSGLEEFGCQNNDDIILKCAFLTTRKYENDSIHVVFATNDKNLAVKAAAHNIITADRNELLHLLSNDPRKGGSQQPMLKNQKVSPSDFSFTLVDRPLLSTAETVQIAACDSSSSSFTRFPQQREISSSYEPRDFVRFKKRSCGVPGLVEQREVQQRRAPYSIRKVGKEGSGRLSKRKRLCQLHRHSMDDFLKVFTELIDHLKRGKDRKSMEDMERINKAIDSVIANESSSLSVLVDMVSKFYDFYADCDVFISATHFDKKQLADEYEVNASTVKDKLRKFQAQLV
ncbi:unnamed protein product [Litomosoides sigmodontis]|uniref:WW domain-containing protein n=1 Tax=Litomosoides sigmodontis TaxID=42156 RepID=A0A3P6SXK7_LITSI|nr:unnamed protein product [Litomosoides sigmodontis]